MEMNRRQFIKSSAITAGTVLLSSKGVDAMSQPLNNDELTNKMPKEHPSLNLTNKVYINVEEDWVDEDAVAHRGMDD